MKTKREAVDWLMKSLGAFVALAVAWVVFDLTANAVNPLGLFSSLAALAFVSALVALGGVLVVAGSLFRY